MVQTHQLRDRDCQNVQTHDPLLVVFNGNDIDRLKVKG